MNKNLPNLLIVGVAKCGTSSLHQYLEQHPSIFMSSKKEPRFITSQVTKLPLGGPKDDVVESWYVKSSEEYEALFSGAEKVSIRGESSADTFYFHKKTIPFIKKNFGDPKIIIIIRNPVKRAFSAYQHLRRDERENLSFEEGLLAEPNRIKDNFELIYHYRSVSLYYEGIKAFLDHFSEVKIIINEELHSKPTEVLQDIFKFLNVTTDVTIDTSQIHNMSGIPKSKWVHKALFEGKVNFNSVRPLVRFFLTKTQREIISRRIQQKNLTKLNLNSETKNRLFKAFEEDISKTEILLNRDLNIWRHT